MKTIKNLKLSRGNYIRRSSFDFFGFDNELKCNYRNIENDMFIKDAKTSNEFYSVSKEYKEALLNLCDQTNNFEEIVCLGKEDMQSILIQLSIYYVLATAQDNEIVELSNCSQLLKNEAEIAKLEKTYFYFEGIEHIVNRLSRNFDYIDKTIYIELINDAILKINFFDSAAREHHLMNLASEEDVQQLAEKILCFNNELYRNDLIKFINNRYDYTKDDISKLTVEVLNDILKEINRHSYIFDNRFYTYGRRDFLEEEIKYYLEKNSLLDAFVDFDQYVNADTWIKFSSIPQNLDIKEVMYNDDKYKEEGIICEQEKNKFIEMINLLKNYIEKSSNT